MRSPDAWHELVDVHQNLAAPGSSWFAQNLTYFPERTHSSKHKISTGPEFDPFCFWMFWHIISIYQVSRIPLAVERASQQPFAWLLECFIMFHVGFHVFHLTRLIRVHSGLHFEMRTEFLSAFSILLYPIFGLILGCKGTNACDSSGTRSCTFPGGGQCILLSASARKGHPLEAGSQRFAERPQLQPFAINVFDV